MESFLAHRVFGAAESATGASPRNLYLSLLDWIGGENVERIGGSTGRLMNI